MEEDFYVPGFTNSLTSGEQSLPTAQPVQTAAYTEDYAPLDLGDWNPSMVNLGNLNVLSDPGPAYDPNSVVRFDTGAKIGVPNASGGFTYQNAAPVVAQPGTTYTLTDYSGNILGQGSTVAEVQKLVALADQNAARGWNLYQGDPVAGGQLFERSPQDNTLKNILIAGATAMGAGFLGPYIQGAGAVAPGAVGAAATPLGAGLAAGAVNTAANLATGANLVDALKSGAMAGLSSAAMTGLLGGGKTPNAGDLQAQAIDTADFLSGMGVNPTLANQIASGSVSNIGSASGGFGGTGGGAGGNLIQVIGDRGVSNIPSSFFSNAIGSATGALSGTNYGNQVWDRPAAQEAEVQEPGESEFNPEEGITVFANKYNIPFDPTSILNTFLSGNYTGTPDYGGYEDLINKYREMYDIQGPPEEAPEGYGEGWDVLAPTENPTVGSGLITLPDLFPPLNSVDIPTDLVKEWPEVPPGDNEIVVEGYPPRADNLLPDIFPPLNSVDIPSADTFKPSGDGKGGPGDGIDIGDILKIIAAAGGAAGAATRKGPSLSSFAGMRGPLNPIFSAQLPAPNMQALSPRSMGGTDWYRYGYGPEQSFFTNVPQGAVNTSTAYTGYDSSAGRTAAAPASFLSSSSYRPLQFSSGLSSASPATAVAAPNGYLPAAEEAAPRVYTPGEIAMYKAMYERTKQASPAPIIPEELNPEATKALLDKAAKSEAIAKRYMKDYGLSEEDLSRLFRGEITSPDLKPVADAFSKEVEDIYGGFANMADATTGDPLRAVERAKDLINQHNQARDWLINAQVSDTSPEWRQQYLDYMSGKTDVPPPGGLSNPDWSWLPAIGKQRGEMGALAGDVVDQWIAASMDPANAEAIAAAKAKQAEMVASGVHGYNSILSRLRNALGGGYAEGGMAEDGPGQTGGGYATGGYAVGGPGDGRDDKIPAMLSDGEYVMDAETVAMLGNGSSKAGAEALDKFRVNLRKHKGRKLSKGEFSVNAKKPEQYLKGRK